MFIVYVMSTFLLVILIGACVIAVRESTPATPKKAPVSIYKKPITASDHGRRDMLVSVYELVYSQTGDYVLRVASAAKNDPVAYIAEILFSDSDALGRYQKFDMNIGRSSKTYMSASGKGEFEQYIKAGREVIDELDNHLANLRNQKEIIESRKYGLLDSDKFHNLSRKELIKLQNRQERAKEELADFEKQMRNIENT